MTKRLWATSRLMVIVVLILVLLIIGVGALFRPRVQYKTSETPTQEPILMRKSNPVTISFACPDYEHERYRSLAEMFHEQYPNITVEILSTDEILGAGDPFDQLAHAADTFGSWTRRLEDGQQSVVLDLSELVANDEGFDWDDFYPGTLAMLERDGKLWGLPFELSTMLIFYNPAFFDEAGVPYPKIGWTWDDLLDAADRLTVRVDDSVVRYGFIDPLYHHTSFLLAHQWGGPLLTTDGDVTRARLDKPEVAAALSWYTDLVSAYEVVPNPIAMEDTTFQQMLHDQAGAMWTGVNVEWNTFHRKYGAGVAPIPENREEGAALIDVYGYFVSAGTVHPKASWRWIEFVSRQPSDYAFSVPARRSVIESANTWTQMDPALAAVLQYNIEHAVDYSKIVKREFSQAVDTTLSGMTAKLALTEAQTRANKALAHRSAKASRPVEPFSIVGPEPTSMPGGTSIRFNVLSSDDMGIYRPMVERFHMEYPEFHVVLEMGSDWRHTEQASKADCFIGYESGTRDATDALLALDPLLMTDSAFDVKAFYPTFLKRLQIDGTLWGLPLDSDAVLVYYNRDLFDRAGRSYPAIDWEPQDLINAALTLADLGDIPPIYGFIPRNGALVNGAAYVAWLGGKLFDAAGYPTFDDPTVIEALTVYADLVSRASPPQVQERNGDRLSGITVSSSTGSHPGWVQSDDVAMWTDTYARYKSASPLSNIGAVPLGQGNSAFYATSRAMFISRKTTSPEACWAWITFVSAQPQAIHYLPVRRDMIEADAWRVEAGEEITKAWLSILRRGDMALPPWLHDPVASRALYWFDVALEDVLAGTLPTKALTEAQDKAAAFVECMGENEGDDEAWRACAQHADSNVVLSRD